MVEVGRVAVTAVVVGRQLVALRETDVPATTDALTGPINVADSTIARAGR